MEKKYVLESNSGIGRYRKYYKSSVLIEDEYIRFSIERTSDWHEENKKEPESTVIYKKDIVEVTQGIRLLEDVLALVLVDIVFFFVLFILCFFVSKDSSISILQFTSYFVFSFFVCLIPDLMRVIVIKKKDGTNYYIPWEHGFGNKRIKEKKKLIDAVIFQMMYLRKDINRD